MKHMKWFALVAAVLFLAPTLSFAAPLKAGDDVPAIEMPLFGGGTFKLADYKGKQGVVLEFSQSACGSCRAMTENLKGYAGSKNYEVVMVNVDAKGGTERWNGLMKELVAQEGITMKIIVDPKYTVAPKFNVKATPALAVIDKNGKFVGSVTGFDNEIAGQIKDLIDKVK